MPAASGRTEATGLGEVIDWSLVDIVPLEATVNQSKKGNLSASESRGHVLVSVLRHAPQVYLPLMTTELKCPDGARTDGSPQEVASTFLGSLVGLESSTGETVGVGLVWAFDSVSLRWVIRVWPAALGAGDVAAMVCGRIELSSAVLGLDGTEAYHTSLMKDGGGSEGGASNRPRHNLVRSGR